MSSLNYRLAILGFLAPLGPAFACTSPTEFPYDPTQYPSDLIIEGITTSTGKCEGDPCADVKLTGIHLGTFPASTYRLKWWVGGGGMCDPPGPDLKVGEAVRIYLTKGPRELRPQGWVLTNEIPKSKDQIWKDQAIAKERVGRQEKYYTAGGALSHNDPKDWLKIEDIPELRHSKFPIYVSFTVGPNGAIEKCESGHVEPHQALDLKACKIIVTRAKLVPPKFPEERDGSFDMYPPDFGNPPPAEPEQESLDSGGKFPIAAILMAIAVIVGGLSVWAFKRARSQS